MESGNRGTVRSRNAVSALLLAVSLLLLVISTRSLAGVPERVGITVLTFVQRGFDAVGSFVSGTIDSVAQLGRLKKSYDELLLKVETLGRVQRDIDAVRRENDALKVQLGFSTAAPYSLKAAKIIAKDPENLSSTIVIDKGIKDGLRKNMVVVAYQDGLEGLVGRILEVGQYSSIVIPIYDSSAYIAARLERSRYEGLVSGGGSLGDAMTMKYVGKRAKEEIQLGDIVITSGYQSIYAADIAIGRVTKAISLDYLTSLELELEPILDFGKLEYVFAIVMDGTGRSIP